MNSFPFQVKVARKKLVEYDPQLHEEEGLQLGDSFYEEYWIEGVLLGVYELTDAVTKEIGIGTRKEGDKIVPTRTEAIAEVSGLYALVAKEDGGLIVDDVHNVYIDQKRLTEYIKRKWQSL